MGKLRVGFRELLAEAERQIESLEPEALCALLSDPEAAIVDLRESEEREQEGVIPGAIHAPRGELEFYADPESPYHREVFSSGKRLVLHCAGGWRSALAARTLVSMGIARVAHLAGGFDRWKAEGRPVERLSSAALAPTFAPASSVRVPVFFYGSYMNFAVLRDVALQSATWQVARLDGYALCIRPRANLTPSASSSALGIVVEATHAELSRLYDHARNVLGESYLPQAVQVHTLAGEALPVLTYLCHDMIPRPASPDYVERIVAPAREFGFPAEYIRHILSFLT